MTTNKLAIIGGSGLYDVITFNFLRLSELHELIFAFYFFIHSYLLKKKIQTIL